MSSEQVIIYSTQRSGTHFLMSLLASHPDVRGLGEIFHENGRYSFAKHMRLMREDEAPALLDEDGARFSKELDRFVDGVPGARNRTAAYIAMYNQVSRLPDTCQRALFEGRKVLHLVRENLLSTHVSNYINNNTDLPAHSTTASPAPVQVHLPTECLLDELESRQRRIKKQRKRLLKTDHIEVTYEKVSTAVESLNDVFGFLGLTHVEPTTSLKRSNPHGLSEILINYDEVRATLKGTKFARFL